MCHCIDTFRRNAACDLAPVEVPGEESSEDMRDPREGGGGTTIEDNRIEIIGRVNCYRLGDTFTRIRLIERGRSPGGRSWLRTLSSFWKYSRRKEIGFSGRPTHSCTIQSFRTCWMLCLCTYSSHSRKLCSSSRFAAILMMHGAPLYRRYVRVARKAVINSRFAKVGG